MTPSEMTPGHTYLIKTKDWETPLREVIPGQEKARKYLCKKNIGDIDFIEVERASGKKHLIAIEEIQDVQGANHAD